MHANPLPVEEYPDLFKTDDFYFSSMVPRYGDRLLLRADRTTVIDKIYPECRDLLINEPGSTDRGGPQVQLVFRVHEELPVFNPPFGFPEDTSRVMATARPSNPEGFTSFSSVDSWRWANNNGDGTGDRSTFPNIYSLQDWDVSFTNRVVEPGEFVTVGIRYVLTDDYESFFFGENPALNPEFFASTLLVTDLNLVLNYRTRRK